MSAIRVIEAELGVDLAALVAGVGSPLESVRHLTSEPDPGSERTAWELLFADGRRLKGRRLPGADRAATVESLAALAAGLPVAPILARRGGAVLEGWITGQSLDTLDLDLDLAERLGGLLGALSQAGAGSPLLGPPRRSVAGLLDKLRLALDGLCASGDLDPGTRSQLLGRAEANAPERLEAGLVHLDFQPRNLILADDGPWLVDNERLDIGILDADLARTWYLWPMSAAAQARFIRGYEAWRSAQRFFLHEVFWAIHTLSRAAAYHRGAGRSVPGLLRALSVLARGDLPRVWAGPQAPAALGRVRVALICDYLAIGGQERILLSLAAGLDPSRFEPFIYAFRGGHLAEAARSLGVPVLIGSPRDPLEAQANWTEADVQEKASYRDTLAAALARDGIDAALVFAWRDAASACQRAGVRVLIEKLDGPALLDKVADKGPFAKAVCESATLLKDLNDRMGDLGLDEKRLEWIYPGIDLCRFDRDRFDPVQERRALGLDPEDLVVGTVGRLIADKNVKLLVRAFAGLDPRAFARPPRLLVMGPDGGELTQLRALAAELGVAERTLFLPPQEDVAPVLAALDVFAITSRREGLPTALLEAMAMGLPILATRAGSIPEVVHENGLLAGFGEEAMATRLAQLLGDSDLRRTLGRRSRALAARFALRHSVGRYEDLILEALAERPPAPVTAPLHEAPSPPPQGPRPRVLAVVRRFKWTHIDYLVALGGQVDLTVVAIDEVHQGAVANGRRWGLTIDQLDHSAAPGALEAGLAAQVEAVSPDLVHCLYYRHEVETLMLRGILDRRGGARRVPLVFECRDPISTLSPADDREAPVLERRALEAADGWICVSSETLRYYRERYGLALAGALIVPHGFAARTLGPPAPKLSAADGRLHLALVGTAAASPRDGRFYGDIIRRLCTQGIVVHSHFHPEPGVDAFYAGLAKEIPDYHAHPKLPQRQETILSRAMSVYDLMGIFHELAAPEHNKSRTLALCMPTKAVCGWALGGIPAVCYPFYRGLTDWIEGYGMGFLVDSLEEMGALARRREDIRRATRACLEHRHLLTHETQASRVRAYYQTLIG